MRATDGGAPPVALEIGVLGPTTVRTAAGASVDLPRRRERALLALLVLHGRRGVTAERLADELWEGAPSPRAVDTLRTYVSRLRSTFTSAGVPLPVRSRGPGYRLDQGGLRLDAGEFEAGLARASARRREGRSSEAAAGLEAALRLWRGPAYADVGRVAARCAEAARLDELRQSAVEDWMGLQLELGHHERVVTRTADLRARRSTREQLWHHRLLALYRAGRQAEAVQEFDAFRRILDEDVGLEPSPRLWALEAQLLRHDPALRSPRDTGGR